MTTKPEEYSPPKPKDGFWTKKEFQSNLDGFEQRVALCRDFDIFVRRKNNHVGLAGTKYNFYVGTWMFGRSVVSGRRSNGETRYTMIYQTFESMLESEDIPNDVKDKLVFHVDFFRPGIEYQRIRGINNDIVYFDEIQDIQGTLHDAIK